MVPLFLQPDCSIVAGERGPILSRQGVPVAHQLQLAEAIALTFLSATGDREEAEKYCNDCLPGGNGSQWVHHVINRYWTYLGKGPARPLDFTWLEGIDRDRVPRRTLHREAAPAAITWLVTLSCNRHCPYCFYHPRYHPISSSDPPADTTFPLPEAIRMVQDMARIGTADLYLTGGEPLLRKDLIEIIQIAYRVNVRTHLATKFPIERALAGRLARAGLTSVTLSLDDARPREASVLAGSPQYLSAAEQAIHALLEIEISVEINAVATRVNMAHLDLLAELAIRLKVPKLSISPFIPPYPRRPKDARLAAAVNLKALIKTLQERYGSQLLLTLGRSSFRGESRNGRDAPQLCCDVGLQALNVLPDGTVTRCRYLPGYPELIVGSLKHQTLLEIWESPPLAALSNPDQNLYEGTPCAGCDFFTACTARGRCYFTALNNAGHLYAPDIFCLKGIDHETGAGVSLGT